MNESVPFAIPLWAELAALGLGALQGALFAGAFPDRRIDVLGVIVVGIALALGGSLLRDVSLGEPPVVIRGEWYLLVAAAAALLGLSVQRLFARLDGLILALDAVTSVCSARSAPRRPSRSGCPPSPPCSWARPRRWVAPSCVT